MDGLAFSTKTARRALQVYLRYAFSTRVCIFHISFFFPLSKVCIFHIHFFAASSALVSSSLAVLLEVKTTHSIAVLSFHLFQCFTPLLRSIPTSFFPHAPCPPSWIPSLSAILTPVLRMCRLFKTAYPALCACLSTDPIWWGNFLRRGKSLKGGRTRRISSESGRFRSHIKFWLSASSVST